MRFFAPILIGSLLLVASISTQALGAPADVNCDASVDGQDVAPWVLALLDPAAYEITYPGCELANADLNCDTAVDELDIPFLVECLVEGHCNHCPPDDMVLIPAGQFTMGDTFEEGLSRERPVHVVYVDAFYLGACEVTNQEYVAGLNWAYAQGLIDDPATNGGLVVDSATGVEYCDTEDSSFYSKLTWNGSTFGVVAGKENHPMLRISWYGAVSYCNWRSEMEGRPPCYDTAAWTCDYSTSGYRLPTEAEWEKAARGGASGRRFPWSDTDEIQHARANYNCSWEQPYDTSPTIGYHPLWGTGDTTVPYTGGVGFFTGELQYRLAWGWSGSMTSYQTLDGTDGSGLYDMAGNLWEWCNDWYGETYYGVSPADNPRGPASGTERVLRGGCWYSRAQFVRCAFRNHITPAYRSDGYGFRLAMTAE